MSGFEHLLSEGGLPMVAVAAGLEGDAVTMVAGALAHRGLWSLPGAALAASLGAFCNDQLWFWVARRSGRSERVTRLLERPVAVRMRGWLGPHPILPILAFRFVWGTRIAAPLVFGATGVDWRTFLALDALAVLVWGALFTGIGYGLGAVVERAIGRMDLGHHLGLVALVVAALVGIAWAVHRRLSAR